MREGVVNLHLDDFGVDHDEAELLRRVAEEQAGDDGIDANALTTAGGARNEQVGHFGEISDDRVAVNIHAECERELRGGLAPRILFEQLAQGDFHFLRVGDFDADRVLAGNRREDIDPLGAGGAGDVALKGDNLVHPHAHIGINFVAGNRGALGDRAGCGLDAELSQRVDDEHLDIFQLLAIEGFAVALILGIQQLRPGHHIILEVDIQEPGREGILCGLGILEFREFGFLGRGRGGIDDFGFRKIQLLLHRGSLIGFGNFDTLLLELAGEFFGFFLEGLALLLDAPLLVECSQSGGAAGLPPGDEGFPSANGIPHGVRGNRKRQTPDIKTEHEKHGGGSENAVNRLLTDPESQKAAWPLDAEFGFPISQEPWLDLNQAGPEENHQESPTCLVAESVAGHEPLCDPVADTRHRQQVGRGPEKKQGVTGQKSAEGTTEIDRRGGVVAEGADDRSPGRHALRAVAGEGEKEVETKENQPQAGEKRWGVRAGPSAFWHEGVDDCRSGGAGSSARLRLRFPAGR